MTDVDLTGAAWRIASACSQGACVEVATLVGVVVVRDRKNPTGTVLTYSPRVWREFVSAAKQGEFSAPH